MDLLLWGLNLSLHIDNNLSGKKMTLLSLPTCLKKETFYKFLNIVHVRFLLFSTMKAVNNCSSSVRWQNCLFLYLRLQSSWIF